MTKGRTKVPVMPFSTPSSSGLPMPARFDAKFWIPPMEATWRCEGATSAGKDQTEAAANVRLA